MSVWEGFQIKIIRKVEAKEVWEHWKKVEKLKGDDFRSDIRDPLPDNIQWYLAVLEEKDVEKLFIISSDDWRRITPTFRLLEAVNALESNMNDPHIHDISKKKEIYQRDIDGLDRRLILVSPSEDGNFTIIEGNKRGVAL